MVKNVFNDFWVRKFSTSKTIIWITSNIDIVNSTFSKYIDKYLVAKLAWVAPGSDGSGVPTMRFIKYNNI